VLRSTKAKGALSFLKHRASIERILHKFSAKNGVKILALANVGNHLHLEIRLSTRHSYRAFIRAITAAIAMAVQGKSRWNKIEEKFWDYRPFTRIVLGYRVLLGLKDYIEINELEGQGIVRSKSRLALGWRVVRPPGF
jgi:REP element-mobilizing transposase RayT